MSLWFSYGLGRHVEAVLSMLPGENVIFAAVE